MIGIIIFIIYENYFFNIEPFLNERTAKNIVFQKKKFFWLKIFV